MATGTSPCISKASDAEKRSRHKSEAIETCIDEAHSVTDPPLVEIPVVIGSRVGKSVRDTE